MKYFMGIDPGMNGGLVIISSDGDVLQVDKMPPTEREIFDQIDVSDVDFCLIEKVHSMPGQGVSSTFKFGVGYGGLRMALTACGIPFDEVFPQKWQRGLGIPKRKTPTETKAQWKNRLKAKAQQLFPDEKITLATCDALLIAEFCRRREMGLL